MFPPGAGPATPGFLLPGPCISLRDLGEGLGRTHTHTHNLGNGPLLDPKGLVYTLYPNVRVLLVGIRHQARLFGRRLDVMGCSLSGPEQTSLP